MKIFLKIMLILCFPVALPVIVGWWIATKDESLPDLLRAYFDNEMMI